MDHFHYRNGELWCEDVPISRIAEEVGTPAYVYSAATFLHHYDAVSAAFAPLDPIICYSIKSCANVHLCRMLQGRGAGFDVVSGGELVRALRAGGDPKQIVFAGVGKTDREIRQAIDAGIGWFNVESEAELENLIAIADRLEGSAKLWHRRPACDSTGETPVPQVSEPQISEPQVSVPQVSLQGTEILNGSSTEPALGATGHGQVVKAALRVNPDVDPQTHRYTTTGKKETKFGVDLERARRVFAAYGHSSTVRLSGIHLHIGSPVNTTAPYVLAIEKGLALIEELRAAGFAIDMLDIGGGFGAHYKAAEAPAAMNYAQAIVPLLRDKGLQIILEPGRSIAANAGILISRVLYLKQSGDRHFLIVDAGMNDLLRPALYQAYHFVWPVRPGAGFIPKTRGESASPPEGVLMDVVGPVCESGDFLAKDRRLPPMKRGDLLSVFSCGAYGMSMASHYNSRPNAPEVLVEGESFRIIRRRETVDDLLAAEDV